MPRATYPPQSDGTDPWSLVEQLLAFASEAEQRIADQQRLIERLESQSVTDGLTGLADRRGFEKELSRRLAAANRHEERGVVAFLDLDGLKETNDRYGHRIGDELLKSLASLLVRSVRRVDFVARLGGDEFVMILVHTHERAATTKLRRLQRQLDRTVIRRGSARLPLRASIGLTAYGAGDQLDEVVARADLAMYRDKTARTGGGYLAACGSTSASGTNLLATAVAGAQATN